MFFGVVGKSQRIPLMGGDVGVEVTWMNKSKSNKRDGKK
jgi:hypothetical protein